MIDEPKVDKKSTGDGHQSSVTVIIPAHNEARVLPACLESLIKQSFNAPMQVIVAANGCDDDTASVAQSWIERMSAVGHTLRVVEIDEPSKPAALNAADELVDGGIRIYVDADVELSSGAIESVVSVLSANSSKHLCAPQFELAPMSSWVSRSFVRVWFAMPYVKEGVYGCGFYALSPQGRKRWKEFPTLLSEDEFVRLQFEPSECDVASDATFTVRFPEGFRELVRVRGRYIRGNRQLLMNFPHLCERYKGKLAKMFVALLRRPRVWPDLVPYAVVYLFARWMAFRQRNVGIESWERAARTWA